MPKSRVTYPAAGTGPYVIPFGYLDQTHLVVYVDGVEDTSATIDTVTATVITSTVPATDAEIRRVTPTTPMVDFVKRSPFSERNLDLMNLQNLYISEELEDGATEAVQAGIGDGAVTRVKLASEVTAELDGLALPPAWDEVTNKPTEFTPEAHAHADPDWADVQNKPSVFAPDTHSHTAPAWTEVTGKPTEFTPETHTHDDRYMTDAEVAAAIAAGGGGGGSTVIEGDTIYDVVADSSVVADYVSEASQGTDIKATLSSYLSTALGAGKRRFKLPAGKYHMGYGSVIDINYDDVEIMGDGIGKTVIYTPGWQALPYRGKHFQFGLSATDTAAFLKLRGIEFRIGWHSGQEFTDGDLDGWRIEPLTFQTGISVEDGQAVKSTDGSWIIRFHGDGVLATEPTWSAGNTTHNGISCTVSAIQTRVINTTYSTGDFIEHADGEIVYVSSGGTTSGTANPSVPSMSSEQGGDDYNISCVCPGRLAYYWHVSECAFKGVIGFNDAGGSGINCGTYAYGDEDLTGHSVGRAHARISGCHFKDFQWGSSIVANINAIEIDHNHFYQTGGWMCDRGGFNAHDLYGQAGVVNIHDNLFDRHMGGTMCKLHINVAGRDGVGWTIRGNEYRDWDWLALDLAGSIQDEVGGVDVPDFDQGTSTMNEQGKGMSVIGNIFRQTKTVVTDRSLGGQGAIMDQDGTNSVMISGNQFYDCMVMQSSPVSHDYFGGGGYSGMTFTGNYVSHTWRTPLVMDAAGHIAHNIFELRGEARSAGSNMFNLRESSKFEDNDIWFEANGTTTNAGVIAVYGDRVEVIGNRVECPAGTDDVFIYGAGDNDNVVIQGNTVHGDLLSCYINKSGAHNWRWERNTFLPTSNIKPYIRGIAGNGWVWLNNEGVVLETAAQSSLRSGVMLPLSTSGRRYDFNIEDRLVDRNGVAVTDAEDIAGVCVYCDDYGTGDGYFIIASVSEDAEHWIDTNGLVANGDWVKLAASGGKVETSGTSGSTTRPTSGLVGIVVDAGTATAGDGLAKIEILNWNLVAGGSGVTDHGALTGLTDDDHSQYHNDTRGDVRYNTKAEITSFLAGKAAATHSHAQSEVTNLTTDLAAKAAKADANVWAKTQSYGEGTLTDAASITWDASTDPAAKVTLAGNRTLANPSNLVAGTTYVLRVIQDATGSRTLAYGTAFKWPGGTAPTLSTAASAIDILTFVSDGTNLYGVEALAFA